MCGNGLGSSDMIILSNYSIYCFGVSYVYDTIYKLDDWGRRVQLNREQASEVYFRKCVNTKTSPSKTCTNHQSIIL